MKPTVAVETYLHPEALTMLEDHCRVIRCEAGDKGAETVCRENVFAVIPGPTWHFTAEALDSMPGLVLIARPGIGVDSIDIEAASARGVLVVNTPDAPTVSTAEHTLALLLAVAKGLKPFAQLLKTQESILTRPLVLELEGKVLGLVGLGRVGKKVAHICGSCLGMELVAYDPFATRDQAGELGVTLCPDLHDMVRQADFVSIHCPPTPETHGMIDAKVLAAMKPTAYLINCARGVIVDERDLVAALQDGVIAGAALDVFDPEPPSPSSPLLAMDNVVATPHSAGYTEDCQRRMGSGVVKQIIDVVSAVRPANLLNAEAWSPRIVERVRGEC